MRPPVGLVLAMLAALSSLAPAARSAERVDIALVLAVDVSGSVIQERYTLQMEGIARAFEDRAVQNAILSGPHRAMLVAPVAWSTRPTVAVPWTLITGASDAVALADRVRHTARVNGDQFTCMLTALRLIADKLLPLIPIPADRTIVDVSGDGRDNCNAPTPVDAIRTELVASGVTINGLPILEGVEAETIEGWYADHVIGGPAAFVTPAFGFKDVERARRWKFLIEISAATTRADGGLVFKPMR